MTRHWRATLAHTGSEVQFANVKLQSWCKGRYTRYWVVQLGWEATGSLKVASTAGESAMDAIIAESTVELKEADEKRLQRGDMQEGLDHDSTWVKEMMWVRHVGSRSLVEIHNATQFTRPKEQGVKSRLKEDSARSEESRVLQLLRESFDREVDRCSWRLDSVPKETLKCLHSIEAGKPHSKPFGFTAQDDSWMRYRALGYRYLAFCWRAYRMGREEAGDRLGAYFLDQQWSLLGDVVEELDDILNSDQADSSGSHDDSGFFSDEEEEDGQWHEDGAADGASDTAGGSSTALDRAVFRFIVASIKVRVGGNMYGNGLLSFCAAIGIRLHPLGYTEAYLYTGMLAALLWISRLFFLEAGFEGQPRELEEVSVEALERFQKEHETWMCLGTYTVASKIISWMAYGKGHRSKTGAAPTVRWSEDEESLIHNGEELRVRDFQRVACKIVRQADELLDTMLNGAWDRLGPQIDMQRLVDNVIRVGAGQSFATNAKNEWLEPGPGQVLRAMEKAIFSSTTGQWKKSGVRKWLQQLRRFREALMVLVHVWGGQPGRGPEVTTLRHCDTLQVMRNIFIYDGQVMIITDRDKMKAIRDHGRKVARFLPERIRRMMVAYIAWLLPAERVLRQKCKQPLPQEKCHEYLWRDGSSSRWNTDQLSSTMIRLMQADLKLKLGTKRYRIMAIEFGRKIQGLTMKQTDAEGGDDDDDESGIEYDPISGEPIDVRGSWNIVWDLQSTHSTRMARLGYAVHVGMPGQLQPQMIASYRGVSRLWHQFLLEGDEARAGWKRKASVSSGSSRLAMKRAKATAATQDPATRERQMEQALLTLQGPGARWKSTKQRESMAMIAGLRGDQGGICVLPTGAGKSLLFMMPAIMPDEGSSVVMVPFDALKQDLMERARDLGIDVVEFRPAHNAARECLPQAARMVVASADTVSVESFHAYVDGLQAAGLLGRVFIDEAHTAITDSEYRAKLEQLKSMCRFECPVIMLTATLPVQFERWFRQQMLGQNALIVRDRTTKKNCRYEVEQVKAGAGAVEGRVAELAREIGLGMMSGDKGVVYCRSKDQCDALAAELGCAAHHGGMSKEARDEAREAWAAGGRHRWIVATTGLGTGIDVGGITGIIHAELPYGLVDFIQQTGRGARRDGETVRSVVVHDGSGMWETVGMSVMTAINREQMEIFAKTAGCRRAVIASFMDGAMGEECADVVGAVPCDRCAPGWERAEVEDEGRWRAHNEREGGSQQMLWRWLDEVEDECAPCFVEDTKSTPAGQATRVRRHQEGRGRSCVTVRGEASNAYGVRRRQVRFAENSCCFRCKLPLDWCKEARKRSGVEEEKCVYLDKVLPVALMPLRSRKMGQWISQRFDIDVLDEATYLRWLGRGLRFHGTRGAQVHVVWEAIIEKACYSHS